MKSVKVIAAVFLCLVIGCGGDSVSISERGMSQDALRADYEYQATPFADGPNGERMVAGLYPDYRPYGVMGCAYADLQPTVEYDDVSIESLFIGACSASYRRPDPRWTSTVRGFFRVGALITNGPPTADANIEFGVYPNGFGTVKISREQLGSSTPVCDVSLDSAIVEAREAACDVTFDVAAWYSVTIVHTERLPESYVGGAINAALDIQLNLPWGFEVEYFTNYDVGDRSQERLLVDRECPDTMPEHLDLPSQPDDAVLQPGIGAKYYSYEAYDCAILSESLIPICLNDDPEFEIRYGSNGAWSPSDVFDIVYPKPPVATNTCAILTGRKVSWAGQFFGYMRIEKTDPSAPDTFKGRIDGDINDGIRLDLYNPDGGHFCTLANMWREVYRFYNYQSITAREWVLVPPNDCERERTYEVGKYYPMKMDFYHHETDTRNDKAYIEFWLRGVRGKNLVVSLYKPPTFTRFTPRFEGFSFEVD